MEPFPKDWTALTSSERIALCRAFATEAEKSERAASPEMKPYYRELISNGRHSRTRWSDNQNRSLPALHLHWGAVDETGF